LQDVATLAQWEVALSRGEALPGVSTGGHSPQ